MSDTHRLVLATANCSVLKQERMSPLVASQRAESARASACTPAILQMSDNRPASWRGDNGGIVISSATLRRARSDGAYRSLQMQMIGRCSGTEAPFRRLPPCRVWVGTHHSQQCEGAVKKIDIRSTHICLPRVQRSTWGHTPQPWYHRHRRRA